MLGLFPSPTLTRYLARLFAGRIVGALLMLVLVLQMLDLLGESAKILAHPGNGQGQVWHYVTLRTPQIIQFALPISVLLGTMATFFPLNQNSEIIAMRAAGLSAHQILAPMLVTALVVAGISFTFNERIVTRATATLKAWQNVGYGSIPREEGVRGSVFVADGQNILFAQTVTGEGTAQHMAGVTWYVRDAAGMTVTMTNAPSASYATPGWRLEGPVVFTVASAATQPQTSMVVGRGISPRQVEMSQVNADGLNILALDRAISALKASGRRTAELEGKWWHKISKPLSAVLMPLLGAVAAFGLARSGQLLVRAVIGCMLGFAYFVADNMGLAMGNFGAYPPLVAAWAPFFLFLAIGETVLIRTEE